MQSHRSVCFSSSLSPVKVFVSHGGTTWLPNVALGFSKSPLWSPFVEHASRALTCEMWNSLDRAGGSEAVVDWGETCTGCSGQIRPNAAHWINKNTTASYNLIAVFISHKFSFIWFRPDLCLVPLNASALFFFFISLYAASFKVLTLTFWLFSAEHFNVFIFWFETRHLQTEAQVL